MSEIIEDKYYKICKNTPTVKLFEIPNNNHGCKGFEVKIAPIDNKLGKVVSGSSCSSCWQVGHDTSESPIPIGAIVLLPKGYGWKRASQLDKNFKQLDISNAERTKITPFQVDVFVRKKIIRDD